MDKKVLLTLFLLVSPIILAANGCGPNKDTGPTAGPTMTATPVATSTASKTATNSPTKTPSGTPTNSPTKTPTGTPTNTPSATPTVTSSAACANPAAVVLGQAGSYVILAETGITDVPSSAVTGNIANAGTGAQITGVTCPEVNGVIYTIDATGPACRTIDATNIGIGVTDKGTAYSTANGLANCVIDQSAGILSGLTLTRGKYFFNTGVSIPTDLHLDAMGDPNARWIFQVNGNLSEASAVNVILDNGALAQNVFWTVTGFTVIGMNAHFEGILMGADYIQLVTGASSHGRLFSHTYVALDQNVVTELP